MTMVPSSVSDILVNWIIRDATGVIRYGEAKDEIESRYVGLEANSSK